MDYLAYKRRREERYSKVIGGEMTVADAKAEDQADERAFNFRRPLMPTGNLSGDYVENQRTGLWFVVAGDGSLTPASGLAT